MIKRPRQRLRTLINSIVASLKKPIPALFLLTLSLMFLGFSYHVYWRSSYRPVKAEVLEEYRQRLRENPYDGSLILQAARHHYKIVRQKLQSGAKPSDLEVQIKGGLSLYRRLSARDGWQLQPGDYFNIAYLYYHLGDRYLRRARDYGLRAHQAGERSEELVTLLANVNYGLGRFDEALQFYDTLGERIRDPVLIFNRAWSLKATGEENHLREALAELKRGLNLIREREPNELELSTQYRLAIARVNLDLNRLDEARTVLRESGELQDNLKIQTLYAEVLLEEERADEARQLLEVITGETGAPERATELLENL